jgi:hypothetical protein
MKSSKIYKMLFKFNKTCQFLFVTTVILQKLVVVTIKPYLRKILSNQQVDFFSVFRKVKNIVSHSFEPPSP